MPSSIGDWYGPPRLAALHQGLAAGVHALADLVVLDAGFHVGGAFGLDEFALEQHDFFRVVELHHVLGRFGPSGHRVETTSTCGYHSTMMFG
jgi:hypothetical protein